MFLKTNGQVLDSLGIVLILQTDLSKDEEGLKQPLLETSPTLLGEPCLVLALELLREDHLGQLQHLPGQLEVGGVLLILDLLLSSVLSLLAVTRYLLLFLLRLCVRCFFTTLGLFQIILFIGSSTVIIGVTLLSVSALFLIIFIILRLLLALISVNVSQDSSL